MRRVKIIYDFIRLWIIWGDRKEAWQDANYLNDSFFIKELEEIEGDIELNALHEIKDFKKKINNMKDTEIIKLQQQLIDVLESQVVDLSMMSKIELGNDVIDEIRRLKNLINEQSR